ncbi:hypothetical protein DYB37_003787 [Aphanomyces astaci]|uniref:DNA recombination and repair protein Rad51-like C-terminal domain-containing protein n=1 Tax=Aphanomyces astaci TaxID=112090 RepID=A0A397A6V0_APHAT|nr:hypothetical protein DYB36_003133 [Aphanomyces astaci]RHY75743.1 hypothetical protein DYB34_000960 [Aphanomyces astaci]RHY78789.1 hypothetical protein DYB38_002387 [Aphanomyces astaci]RHY91877.1 hypothetical protein DYB35_005081 [Aphanomyces astaci]RHZ30602.1 hypothetical protein DYB37_003787 [Aphanomyces astaci]
MTLVGYVGFLEYRTDHRYLVILHAFDTQNSCLEKATKKAMAKEVVKEVSAVQEPAVVSDDEGNEDDTALSYERIEVLQDAGINATDIAKLKEDGFATVGQLFQVSMKRLLQVKGVSEAKAEKLIQAAKKV